MRNWLGSVRSEQVVPSQKSVQPAMRRGRGATSKEPMSNSRAADTSTTLAAAARSTWGRRRAWQCVHSTSRRLVADGRQWRSLLAKTHALICWRWCWRWCSWWCWRRCCCVESSLRSWTGVGDGRRAMGNGQWAMGDND